MYVAMTRAREKLIITATLRDAKAKIAKLSLLPEEKVAPQIVMPMANMAEWILTGTRDRDSIDNEVEVQIVTASTLTTTTPTPTSTHTTPAPEDEPTQNLPDFCPDFMYQYQMAPDLPSKLTVTGVKNAKYNQNSSSVLSNSDSERASWVREDSKNIQLRASPDFISKQKTPSAAERGILLHLVMQNVDYEKGSDESEMRKELQLLVKTGVLTEEQVLQVDVPKIVRFFNSDTGKRLISSKNIKREFKFSVMRSAEHFFQNGGKDKILLQGVVDCFFEEDNALVVIDFKTDKVTMKNAQEKAKHYAPQLDAYADALESITGKHVKEKIIYFFSLNKAYLVD